MGAGTTPRSTGDDEQVVRELRAERETFVCEGQFGDALQRILERHLTNLDGSRQDSVWVSGFFGSGKSHLLKMLAHLWANTQFEDGATRRGLVPRGLPSGVEAALRELDGGAKRTGIPAVAAAGSLLGGNVDHVRQTVLSVLLGACGWPTQYLEVEVAVHRERLLSTAVQEIVSRIRLPHGEAKQRRKLALHTNTDPDGGDGDAVRVWLRDEWSCSWKEVLGEARGRGMEDPVLQGGGGELHGDDLQARIETGAEASLARLSPRFPDGDHRAWGVALKRARDGSDAPLVVVGWDQSVADHPVAREVLGAMSD